MPVQDLTIPARDGYPLSATLYRSETPDASFVIIAAAMGVKRGYYGKFADYLAAHGLNALTFDYRGIGGSKPPRLRGFAGKASDWGTLDLAGIIGWVDQENPSAKISLVGHSIGGQLPGITPNADRLSALFLVAAQSGHWRWWRGITGKAMMLSLWYIAIPTLTTITGKLPGWAMGGGENVPPEVAREWASWGRNRDYILSYNPDAIEGFRRIQAPVVAMSFADDQQFAPEAAVDALASWYTSAQLDRRHVTADEVNGQRIGHFGFFRSQFADTLWQDATNWLTEYTQKATV
jgi:predicted alpha/beta hydrolase